MKLKIISSRLIWTKKYRTLHDDLAGPVELRVGDDVAKRDRARPSRGSRFESGPAAATIASPRRPPCEVQRVDRRRLGPAEPERSPGRRRADERQRQERAADRVEMGDRVERQPPEQLRRAVAEPVRRECVAEFVDRQTDEQHDRDDDHGRQDAVQCRCASGTLATGMARIVAGPERRSARRGRRVRLEPREQVRLLAPRTPRA